MSVLVVGSVALDSVETAQARVDRVIGGSAVFFGASASFFTDVRVVAVVGDDYPLDQLRFLEEAGVNFEGLERAKGPSFFWAGRYSDDFARRETLETRLGVFGAFDPVVPDAYRGSEVVFLGNIDPVLQLGVLDQITSPRLVAADTMNYWIERSRDAVLELAARLDVLLVNDEEARQLAGEADLSRAAAWIRDRGPALVVVKRGARGAVLFADGWTFSCPAHPASAVVDPTGAGDAFAGGFLGHLDRELRRRHARPRQAQASSGAPQTPAPDRIWQQGDWKQAMAYGAVMGSCAVEAFSADRFRGLDGDKVEARAASLAPPLTYAAAGVDLDAADRAKSALGRLLSATRDANTLSAMGAFGGAYALPAGLDEPVLVASADGVGTKLKVAFAAGRHDTVGQDLVNHCVNDVLVQGARPLFFLDYLATGDMEEGVVAQVVAGIARACQENQCVLLGGETAQMPDFYAAGEYDLAGFVVGVVERGRLLGNAGADGAGAASNDSGAAATGPGVTPAASDQAPARSGSAPPAPAPGDRLIALPSSGLHTNGFTLARAIVFERMGLEIGDAFPGEDGASVADVLLRVHRSYLDPVGRLIDDEPARLKALAHVTGGGIAGNLPRVLSPGQGARIDCRSWMVPNVFRVLARGGSVEANEMYRVFNMGVGMILVVGRGDADAVLDVLPEGAWVLGDVVAGDSVELAGVAELEGIA